jgi:Ca2+/Na+ antiporter
MPLANAAAYPIWANALIFLAAAGVIWQAGSRLTRTLDAIAEQSGLDHAFVGMLLLGGITSLRSTFCFLPSATPWSDAARSPLSSRSPQR